MSRAIGLGFVAVALAACGPSYRKLNLDQLQSVAVIVDEPNQTFCAYAPVALRALVTYKNGDQARSRTPGEDAKGLLRTVEFEWSSNRGTVDPLAVLRMPDDALAWFDEPITVTARVAARPTFVGEGVVRPRFDCGGTLDLRGSVGARGGEAEDGGPGAPGPDVEVALAYLDTQRNGRLVLVRVQRGDDPPEHYLVAADSARKPFVIDAGGGAGGRGGQGVAGIDGPAGPDGATCGDRGPGQNGADGAPGSPGGPGRDGGPGAPGGRVHLRYDARFPELRALIEVRVEGGAGGEAGSGGAGGRGGPGGRGGDACPGIDGSAGAGGTEGEDGPPGADGRPGDPGGPGEIVESAGDVTALFADELARGLPIVAGEGGGS